MNEIRPAPAAQDPQPSMQSRLKKPLLRVCDVVGLNGLLGSTFLSKNLYVIGYHSVTDPATDAQFESWRYPDQVKITKGQLEREMDWLSAHGHTFIGLHEMETALQKGVKKPTVIYFDDGYKDTLQNALPILEKQRIPAAVFLVTDLLDGTRRTLRGFTESEDPSFSPFLDWEGAKELVTRGVTIGSHGVTHTKFTNLSAEALDQELRTSKQMLEDRLRVEIRVCSYPHGRANPEIAEQVRNAGYDFAVTTREGVNTHASVRAQPFLLKKVDPRGDDSLRDFRAKLYVGGLVASVRKI